MAWKKKHNYILSNKTNIIKYHEEGISLKKIANTYKVSTHCIYDNLRLWNPPKKHGIKYLLKEMLLSE